MHVKKTSNFQRDHGIVKKVLFQFLLLSAMATGGIAQINYKLYNDFPRGPVGGGPGYEAIVQYDNSFTRVNSLAELSTALANSSVKKIFIPSNLSFQVDAPLEITTDDLLLAGDRGQLDGNGRASSGALLRLRNSSAANNNLLISVRANNVRITGLRLTCEDVELRSAGIQIKPKEGLDRMHLEVDNCELFNWGYAAIRIDGPLYDSESMTSGWVHHNHIHHNNKDSLGYGIAINYRNAHCLILYNYFNENRHSVAGNGRPNEKYTAAYNLSLKNLKSSEYDMHGYSDYNKNNCDALATCNPYCPCNHAGAKVILLNNAAVNVRYFFGIRGIPTQGAYMTRNLFSDPSFYKLWKTWTETEKLESCMLTAPHNKNIKLDINQWSAYNVYFWNNNINPLGRYIQYVSWSGVNNWKPLFFNPYQKGKIAVGDFNGDQVSDIFYGDGNVWLVSWNGVTPWDTLATSQFKTHQLAFGDFNGDGKTDVFRGNGSKWLVSWGGNTNWETLATSRFKTHQLAFGDFNSDGKTDVFRGNGSKWLVSWSGNTNWDTLATSQFKTHQLAFGDFNDDGKTDVFRGNGSKWKVSWSGNTTWVNLATSQFKTHQLVFGDFNGDGKTDIIREAPF